MKNIKYYNFNNLQDAIGNVSRNPNNQNLEHLKRELNKFFSDSECTEILYTKNTDRLFFGMCVMASIPVQDYNEVIQGTKPYIIKSYKLEIDSRLLDLDLNDRELTAILLHEIGHVVNDSTPIEKVRNAIDLYMVKERDTLSVKDSNENRQVIIYAINDTIRKFTSIFNRKDDEILADEFVFMCGYGQDLESSFRKINSQVMLLNRNANVSKLIKLEWALRVYKEMGISRLTAIKILNRSKTLTGSKLEKREIEKAIHNIEKPKDLIVQEAELFINEYKNTNNLLTRVQRKGLRALEDDLYQYQIRVKNVDDENEALLVLRQINNRMGIIDEYIAGIDPEDDSYGAIERYRKLYYSYADLRDTLTKKASYNKKMYGLFIDYSEFPDPNR